MLIAGPTASGKSALALRLAENADAVVVNADSMQVYDALPILSARPSAVEMAAAPHRLYGFVDPGRAYSVGDYLRDAGPLVAELRSAGRRIVIVGGTGLYFRALTEGLVETPETPPALRAALEAEAAAGGDMHARLARLDTEAAARLAAADLPRILRALEVIEGTGRTLAEWRAEAQGAPLLPPGSWRGVFLAPEREALVRRIDARFAAMIEAGALGEVRALMDLGLPPNRGVMKAHGAPHLAAHLRGEITLAEAIARGRQDTRRYAKRQMTWAKKFMAGWAWLPA